MPSATMTSKGQITVPKAIREALRVGTGDRLEFVLEGPSRVVVRPTAWAVSKLKGLLYLKGRPPVSLEAMAAAIARHR